MAKVYGSQIGGGIGTLAGYAFGPLGGAIGGALGSILGGLFDEGPDVQQIIEQMMKQYEGIVPPNLARAISYAQYQQGGQLTPQQLSELPIEAQKAVQLVENPEMRQKQQVQLQQMQQLAQTGMGPQELLALEKSRRTAASDAQARLKSLMQQYQQMGQAGGGASLAAALQSGQAADDQEAMSNMQASAMAAENRRNAIQQAFSAASGMRQQDLSVSQYNSENLRQKQMFDIQNAMTRQQLNAQYMNQANMYNLQRSQQVMDMNLQQQNQELYRQQYLAPQQAFQNQMAMAGAKANIYGMQAGLAQQQNQAQAQAMSNAITGFGQLGLGIGQMGQNDQYMQMKAAANGLVKDASGNWVNQMSNVGSLPDYNPPSGQFQRQEFGNRFGLGGNYNFNQPNLNFGLEPIDYNQQYNPMLNWYKGTGNF